MDLIFAALSVQDLIERFSGYAALAAIPGLAVLTLLYFAQAREVKRLREWAGNAPEQARELDENSLAFRQQFDRVPAVRRIVPGSGQEASPGQATQRLTAAQLQGVDTHPAHDDSEGDEVDQQVEGVLVSGNGEVGDSAPHEPQAEVNEAPGSQAAKPPMLPMPATAAATGVYNASAIDGDKTSTDLPLSEQQGKQEFAEGEQGKGKDGDDQASSPKTGTYTSSAKRFRGTGSTGRARRTRGRRSRAVALIAASTLAIVGVGTFAFTRLSGNGTADTPPASPTQTVKREKKTAPIARGRTVVSVLNGTTISGLAADVADNLVRAGFKKGSVTNATNQQSVETVVDYTPGYKRAAQEVAKVLGVSKVQSIDADTQAVAGADAMVVVVVGADRTQ
jgi:hypothetical protein